MGITEIINIQTLVTSILVAVPISFFSVFLALRRYRTEKWWDKKAECYIQTVNALNDMIRFCDSYLAEELDGKDVSNEDKVKLKTKYHNGKMILDTQTNIGRLLLSDNSYSDLLSLDNALFNMDEQNITQEIAGIRVEVEECLHSFITNAKLDLGVRRFSIRSILELLP